MTATIPLEPQANAVLSKMRDDFPLVTRAYWFDEPVKFRVGLCIEISSPKTSQTWSKEGYIDSSQLQGSDNPAAEFAECAFDTIEELVNSIPVDEIGLYPFARIWHDTHNKKAGGNLLWRPNVDVPGYVFSRAYQIYPKDKGKNEAQKGPVKVREAELAKVELKIQKQELKKMRKVANMATGTKKGAKKKIVRAPVVGYDPTKVKAPDCVNHKEPMVFDKVEQKWRCPVQGCKVVARPKRDEDDRSVILGKGSVQMRLVVEDDKRSVVLISDDNVALNITPFVDIEDIIQTFDVIEQAKVASGNGKENFTVPTEKNISLLTRLVVMGATDLTE